MLIKMLRISSSISVLVVASALLLTSSVPALASTYGTGSYGNGNYDNVTNSGSSNAVSSTVSSVSNTIAQWFCTEQAPSSAPFLYEIDATGSTAVMYFAPAAGPEDRHYAAFGQGNNSEGYGAEFTTNNPKGALKYQVNLLSPNTFYTFKVRGGHGCKPGAWSSTMTVKTLGKGVKRVYKYYPTSQAKYIPPKQVKTPWYKQIINKIVPHK